MHLHAHLKSRPVLLSTRRTITFRKHFMTSQFNFNFRSIIRLCWVARNIFHVFMYIISLISLFAAIYIR